MATIASTTSHDPPDELVTAVGQYVLGELSLGRAAEEAGLSRWEFETVFEEAGFTALYGPRSDADLRAELDATHHLEK